MSAGAASECDIASWKERHLYRMQAGRAQFFEQRMPGRVTFVDAVEPRLENVFFSPIDRDLAQLGDELDGLLVTLGIEFLDQQIHFLPRLIFPLRERF